MNEVVKYHNYMNNLNFKGFTSVDMNVLMTLCAKMRDKDVERMEFSFEELRALTGYKQTSVEQFTKDLKRMNDKLQNVACTIETEDEIVSFVLFPTYRISKSNGMLAITVNQEFRFVLNNLTKDFTRFELAEFVSLDSKYAKSLYRILKQYRTQGWCKISVNEFRLKIDCPSSYSNKYLMDEIIKPAVKTLQPYFTGLKVEVEKAKKRGNPVTGYYFTFQKEHIPDSDQIEGQMSIVDFPEYLPSEPVKPSKKSGFSNFESRSYDMDELEKQLTRRK